MLFAVGNSCFCAGDRQHVRQRRGRTLPAADPSCCRAWPVGWLDDMRQSMGATARTVAAAALVGVALLAAGTAPAHAASSRPAGPSSGAALLDLLPPDVRERMTAQIPLVDAASV